MNMSRARSGFVLPLAIVIVAIVAVIVAAVGGYVSNAARQTRVFLAKDRCRFAALSAIEQAKSEIQQGFLDYIAANFASIQIAPGKAKAYNWFNSVGSDHRTLGSPNPVTIFSDKSYPLTENDCRVWVGLGRFLEHETNAAQAIVPVVATAEYAYPDGLTVTVTVQERILFGTGQSKVFDNAYFVNNYGWMNGNFTINGEFRANGNVSLKGGCVVNGLVSAAPNAEIGAAGSVTINNASIKNRSTYRSSVGTRARYDTGNLDELGSYDPATASGTIVKPTFAVDGTQTGGSKTEKGLAVVEEGADPVEMPFVSELQPYVEYAQEEGGTLRYPSVTFTDSTGTQRTMPGGTVNAVHTLSKAGPSGDASLADAGSLLLVGTQSNPVVIDGPVVVSGDVIIKGYVKGQGTIYAGRNVHIIGDLKYVNTPTWTKSKTGSAATAEQETNESKDMLGLIAKGNIVIGDATSSSIASSVNSGDTIAYACDENDSAIGYPSKSYSGTQKVTTSSYRGSSTTTKTLNTFAGDYTATEQINSLSSSLAATAPGGYQTTSGKFGKVRVETVTLDTYHTENTYDWWGRKTGTKRVYDTETRLYTSYDRRYYETICDDAIISGLKGTVSQVDAIMYNNHGVFGSLGSNFQVNGALVCRDEGLTANGGSFNWDMRLRRKKDSEIVQKMGLPKGAGDPYVVEWLEVPDDQNPLYVIATGGTR